MEVTTVPNDTFSAARSAPARQSTYRTGWISGPVPILAAAVLWGTTGTASSLAPAVTAVVWGFFIYLALMSGTIAMSGTPFQNTTPEEYLRMAGVGSLLAFVVGWSPQIVTQMVSQVGSSRTGKIA